MKAPNDLLICSTPVAPLNPQRRVIGAGKSVRVLRRCRTRGAGIARDRDLDPEQRARPAAPSAGTRSDRGDHLHGRRCQRPSEAHIEVIVKPPHPAVGIRHAAPRLRRASLVMVNVEADVWRGRLLARSPQRLRGLFAGYGDQPALTAEMVDGARATGFRVVAAGRATKYLPAYPTLDAAGSGGHYDCGRRSAVPRHNPQMFNSFLDGTKPQWRNGGDRSMPPASTCRRGLLLFPPCGVATCRNVMRRARPAACWRKSGVVGSGGVAVARRPSGVPRSALGVSNFVLEAPKRLCADCSVQ